MIEDRLRKLLSYYYRSPGWVKTTVGYAYRTIPMELKLGEQFRLFQNSINESYTWSSEDVIEYQYKQIRKTLEVAYNDIPFYREFYDNHSVSPSDFKSINDLARFPTLTKEMVKDNIDRMINPRYPNSAMLTTTTGGSTAEPMRFMQLKGVTRPKERAFICAGWARVGYQYGDKAVQLKGRPVGKPGKGVFWEYEPIQNYLEMDSNYLTDENIPAYLEKMKAFGASFLIGFPSSIYLIAKYLRENNVEPPRFRAVMLASENVYPWQRELLEQVFECRIYSHYGHSEMVLLGMESEVSHDLLFFPHYGYLEVLDAQGNAKTLPGEKGELVGTSFHNPVMPFIRYRTQDIGTIGHPDPKLPHFPVLSDVEGRLQEFIVTGTGRLISICTMGAAHFDVLDRVAETQYFQQKAGELEFHVVPKEGFNYDDEQRIYKALKGKVGDDVDLKVKCVDSIKRTKSGKHMMLVQKIEDVPLYDSSNLEQSA